MKRTATIIQRRTFNSAAASSEDRRVEDVRGLIWSDHGTTGRQWKDLAKDAEIGYTTLRNFAAGETKRPAMHTILKLMDACSYEPAWRRVRRRR